MIESMRYSGERRDIQRAIDHWRQNTWGEGCVPLLDTFDFSPMRGEWGYRFLICGSYEVETAVFVTYGAGFAELLDIPQEPVTNIPFIRQIPKPCRTMFSEGYTKAILESSPVTLEGTFRFEANAELYRAAFMPIMLRPNWSKLLIFGSFNCRSVTAV